MLVHDSKGNQGYTLFAIIQNSWYWAIEWKISGSSTVSYLTDFNAGLMNADVKKGLVSFTEVSAIDLRSKFGAFADYIERAVSAYGSYITSICHNTEAGNVSWPVSAS